MKQLIKLLIRIFNDYLENICIIEDNIKYTYHEILSKASSLSLVLNKQYPEPIRIALIAKNSGAWVISFIGILLSRHKLVLFPATLSIESIKHIIVNSRSTLLITDIDPKELVDLETICLILVIDNVRLIKVRDGNIVEEDTQESIIVYSPRKLEKHHLTLDSIVEKLRLVDKYGTFNNTTIFIAYPAFCYDYIIALLLPLVHGVTIIIPNQEEDSWGTCNTIQQNEPEVVILNARQFEGVYEEYIKRTNDPLIEILEGLRLNWIKKWVMVKRVKKLFPKLKQLIILNSQLNTQIEHTLKELKVPYIVTYGRVKGHGIETFSDLKDFQEGTIGEFLKEHNDILEDDKIYLNYGNKFFYHRDNQVVTKFGYQISDRLEKTIKDLPIIDDCILVILDGLLTLIVVPNFKYTDYYRFDMADIIEILDEKINELNHNSSEFEKIEDRIVLNTDFLYDTYGRVMKNYYTQKENVHL
jgi:chaperonin cofactor prefoldin